MNPKPAAAAVAASPSVRVPPSIGSFSPLNESKIGHHDEVFFFFFFSLSMFHHDCVAEEKVRLGLLQAVERCETLCPPQETHVALLNPPLRPPKNKRQRPGDQRATASESVLQRAMLSSASGGEL